MDPKTSLFARARPRVKLPKPKKKRTLTFLDLPGETRNRIYQYYFQDTYRCELVGHGCDLSTASPKTVTLALNRATRYRVKSRKDSLREGSLIIRFPRLRRPGLSARHDRPCEWLNQHGALILVCRKVHMETLPLLYRRITFVFEAPHRINGFLHKVPQSSYNNVTKLHLHYGTYGSPGAASDVIWQDKHIESWTRACKAAATSFTCLRELEVDLWIHEYAPKFNLRQKLLQPLWQFRRLAHTDGEEDLTGSKPADKKLCTLKVFVRVRTRLFLHHFGMNTRLAKACKHLHGLYGQGVGSAICGAKEDDAMAKFNAAWEDKYKIWQHHLGFARTGW